MQSFSHYFLHLPAATFDDVRKVYVYIVEKDESDIWYNPDVHGYPANKLFFVDPSNGSVDEICEMPGSFAFSGDIVYKHGKVYLASEGRWGVLDFTENEKADICSTYTSVSEADSLYSAPAPLQLAVNKEGDLIANDVGNPIVWYKMTGDIKLDGVVEAKLLYKTADLGPGREYQFNDLASGTTATKSDSGWSSGNGFGGKNWATYMEIGKACPTART
jgi:hypothetical protein